MSLPVEELVRPYQLAPNAQRIPVDASLTSGKLSINSATVGQGNGGGYAIDETIIPSGGAGTPAIFRVSDTDAGGAVRAVTIDSGGSYTILPSSPAGQRLTSGTGQGATFDIGANGQSSTVKATYTGVGKLPAPVSDLIGISICHEGYEEVPGTRKTHNDQVTDSSGSGAFITVARTDQLTMKKASSETMLSADVSDFVGQAFAEIAADVTNQFEKSFDTRSGKCNIGLKFHNPV